MNRERILRQEARALNLPKAGDRQQDARRGMNSARSVEVRTCVCCRRPAELTELEKQRANLVSEEMKAQARKYQEAYPQHAYYIDNPEQFGFVYVVGHAKEGPVKIGFTDRPRERFKQLRQLYGKGLRLWFIGGGMVPGRKLEDAIHFRLQHRRSEFYGADRRECFAISAADAVAMVGKEMSDMLLNSNLA